MTGLTMQERFAPSRPLRLGTRRRALRKSARREADGGHARAQRADSLDTKKQLATTVHEWLAADRTDMDVHREKRCLHRVLTGSYHKIWQKYAHAADKAACAGEADDAAVQESLRAKWEKRWLRVLDCQKEWVAYYADCCKGFSAPAAIPIGCNDRLCPLCAHHRGEKARRKLRTMFDRLSHPALITLTVPNLKHIRKHDFTIFRQRVRKFIAQHKGWIQGGVYSLETTYNRREKTWHIHVHILADLASPLPPKTDKVELAGMRMTRFRAIKLRLEFGWLRLWRRTWGTKPRTDCAPMVRMGDEYRFEEWVRVGHTMRRKEWRDGQRVERIFASPAEAQMCFDWNCENRIVVDVKPVDDRERVAYEVLKYITKSGDFADLPEAVEPFCDAVRGARLIQTFGSWYGVKLDDAPNPEHLEDWGQMKCACGLNAWKRLGVFHDRDVEMGEDGRWRLRRPYDWKSPGTVARPTIRALDAREG